MDRSAEAETEALLQRAAEALQVGEWSVAKERFEAVLADADAGEAWFGLGIAQQWLGDSQAAIRHWERAYADFRRRRDAQQAVLAAFYLCLGYRMILGNEAASRGWCQRAASVVEDLDAAELDGWVELARAYVANESGRPQEGELHAREALAIARANADSDLELCTKGELGASLVAIGRLEEGMALLDEAMAGALAGEGDELDTVVLISCRTIFYLAARLPRVPDLVVAVCVTRTVTGRPGSPVSSNGTWAEVALSNISMMHIDTGSNGCASAACRSRPCVHRRARRRADGSRGRTAGSGSA